MIERWAGGPTTKLDPGGSGQLQAERLGSPGVQQRVPAHSDRTGQSPQAAAGKSRAETLVQTPGRFAPTSLPPCSCSCLSYFPFPPAAIEAAGGKRPAGNPLPALPPTHLP